MPISRRTHALVALVATIASLAALPAVAVDLNDVRPVWGAVVCHSANGTSCHRTYLDVPIEMSDGVRLKADLFVPVTSSTEGEDAAQDGPYPTLIRFTPYGKDGTRLATHYAREVGYAVLHVDVRGTGASGGSQCLMCEREQLDVKEVVEWAVQADVAHRKQDIYESNGKAVLQGQSYGAILAVQGAAKHPQGLVAVIAKHPYSDPYRDAAWHNGMLSRLFLTQWQAYQTSTSGAAVTGDGGLARADNTSVTETFDLEFDGPWYWERATYTKFDQVKVPVLFFGGWFDGFARGTIRNFQGVASTEKILYMDPFGHHQGQMQFEPASRYAELRASSGNCIFEIEEQWLARHLEGDAMSLSGAGPCAKLGITDIAPVTYFDLGAMRFEQAESWPPRGVEVKKLNLAGNGDGLGLLDGADGDLSPGAAAKGFGAEGFIHDPTVGISETFSRWGEVGVTPQYSPDGRMEEDRMVTFTTSELTQPLRLAGPVELDFWATTTAAEMDWVVRIADVAPDGSSTLMTTGYLRASHREVDEARSRPADPWISNLREVEVVPGGATRYRVDILPTAWTLQPRHRLQVAITSSDVPTHDPLPVIARNEILHGRSFPSRLLLTTLPARKS